jgi:hypothetical protein
MHIRVGKASIAAKHCFTVVSSDEVEGKLHASENERKQVGGNRSKHRDNG